MTGLADFAARFCKMNCPVHSTEHGWPHDPDCETLQAAVRTEAMDALIAGDADLYDVSDDVAMAAKVVVGTWTMNRNRETERMDKAIHRLSVAIASTRIKGDKDRGNPVERPREPEYDHTHDGTANFERALAYARSLEVDADFSNSQYAFFMAERGDQLRMLAEVLEAICAMQALRYGDATGTHLALSALCQSARATLAKARGEQP